MTRTPMDSKAFLVGGGIGSMAAAAFVIRDGGVPGPHITIYEGLPVLGGSLCDAGSPKDGYSMRGGRMLTTDNYECIGAFSNRFPLSPIRTGLFLTKQSLLMKNFSRIHAHASWMAIAPLLM